MLTHAHLKNKSTSYIEYVCLHVVIFVSILTVASLFPKLLRSAPFLPVSFSAVMSFICHTLDCTLGFLDMLVDFLVTHTLSSIELHGF